MCPPIFLCTNRTPLTNGTGVCMLVEALEDIADARPISATMHRGGSARRQPVTHGRNDIRASNMYFVGSQKADFHIPQIRTWRIAHANHTPYG